MAGKLPSIPDFTPDVNSLAAAMKQMQLAMQMLARNQQGAPGYEIFQPYAPVVPSYSAPAPVLGVANGSNAPAGYVGEYKFLEVPIGSTVSLVSITAKNVTSLALTPGDWDLYGIIATSPAGTTTTSALILSINTVPNALVTAPNGGGYGVTGAAGAAGYGLSCSGRMRVNISVPTTYYLVAYVIFAVSTCGAFGGLYARRVR
jgi:hypothetical protein